MISFNPDLHRVPVEAFLGRLQLFSLAESLGGMESLVEQPWFMSHASMDENARQAAGITPATIRMSIGIEHCDDLIADLKQALQRES